jgi:hypothetical protein
MTSSKGPDLLDLDEGFEVTAADVVALRQLRAGRIASLLGHPEWLAPAWPGPGSLSKRPTAAGRAPFEL